MFPDFQKWKGISNMALKSAYEYARSLGLEFEYEVEKNVSWESTDDICLLEDIQEEAPETIVRMSICRYRKNPWCFVPSFDFSDEECVHIDLPIEKALHLLKLQDSVLD